MSVPVFRPINNRVVIRREEAQEKTPGGLILPDRAKEAQYRGTVLAVGPGKLITEGAKAGERVPMTVKPGDVVRWADYLGAEVKVKDQKYVVCFENDILAVEE